MAIRKNKKFIDPRYFMDEKTGVIKEGADSSGHIDAWLIRLVANIGPNAFEFDPSKPPLPIDGRGASETWQEQQKEVAMAIEKINSGKYTAQQLQRATKMANTRTPPAWIALAAKIAQRPEPLTTMGKIKGMFGLEELKGKQ